MREILFRGKRVDKGEWTYGYYCPKPYSHFPCEATIFPSETIDRDWHGERVEPDTIGQFTGLIDCNGVKIFEGDIVKYFDSWIGKVEYDSDSALFAINFVDFVDGDYSYFGEVACGFCEVIGNIYDNPELMEVSGND